jgi:predicted site-specific integrase-resolvase
MPLLLTPTEVDELLRFNPGRSLRLARSGKLPHIKLPGGDIRFLESEIEKLLASGRTRSHREVPCAN